MIPFEEFRYGADTNYKLKSETNIKQTLKQQSLDTLTSLRLSNNDTHKRVTLLFPTEDVITVTNLTKQNDSFGRDGTNNHTIIIKITDYLKQYPPEKMVEKLFDPLEEQT